MTDFLAWRTRLGWSQRTAAKRLGVTLKGYQLWEWEKDNQGDDREPPLTARLAAAALEAKLPAIGE